MAAAAATAIANNLFVDTRGQFSVSTFSGKDDDWPAWCVKFESYCELVGLGAQMEEAVVYSGSLSLAALGTRANDTARVVFALLISKTEGKALGLVMLSEKHNGLEAWRKLKDEYEAKHGGRLAAMLRGILNPALTWTKDAASGKEFLESLTVWERRLTEYRLASGEDVSENILVATVLEHCPQQYRDMLRSAPQTARLTYAAVRGHIKKYCVVSRTYADTGILDTSSMPMYIGQLKGKGKHKGDKGKQGKGKSKDKSSKGSDGKKGKKDGKAPWKETTHFQGDCGYCGKWGHKRADCRKRIAAEGTGGAPSATAIKRRLELRSIGSLVQAPPASPSTNSSHISPTNASISSSVSSAKLSGISTIIAGFCTSGPSPLGSWGGSRRFIRHSLFRRVRTL